MKPIQLKATINLSAAATGKPRRFSILAYSGGKLVVDGFEYPVIVDLEGLEARKIPILLDHQPSVENTVGQTDSIRNDGESLVLAGHVTGRSDRVRQVLEQADAGHQWQASIGCAVHATSNIPLGQTVVVNGQTFVGPVIVARSATLRETSVLPIGADSTTSVNLSASAKTLKGQSMSFEEWASSKGFELTGLSSEATAFLTELFNAENPGSQHGTAAAAAIVNLRATHAADHERIAKIENLTTRHPAIAATAIRGGWSPEKTEIAVLKANQRNHAPSNRVRGDDAPNDHQVLVASFAISAGASPAFLAKSMGEKVVDEASRLEARGASLKTVMDCVLKAAGMTAPSRNITDAYISSAFQASRQLEASGLSTMSLPGILSNAANKLLLEGFTSIKPTWQEFCAIGNLADFKTATRYRMIGTGQFEEVAPGGEIKHLSLNNTDTYSNQAKTYATMLGLDRQAIVNDDLGAFESLPKMLGRMGAIQLEKQIYTKLLGNSGAFFDAANDNKLTGVGSALDIEALTAAEKLFLTMVDVNGDPIMLTPELLLVPPTLSVTANQLVRDTQVVAVGVGSTAATMPDGNPHAGRFKAIVSPWLENANLTNQSATGWYLLARPQGSSGLLEVGFLNGQQSPTIEHGELDFSQLGLALRGYFDFGVAHQDGRFGVFNVGA